MLVPGDLVFLWTQSSDFEKTVKTDKKGRARSRGIGCPWAEFLVIEGEDNTIMLWNAEGDSYLRVRKDGSSDCKGQGGSRCNFNVQVIDEDEGTVSLSSEKDPDLFLEVGGEGEKGRTFKVEVLNDEDSEFSDDSGSSDCCSSSDEEDAFWKEALAEEKRRKKEAKAEKQRRKSASKDAKAAAKAEEAARKAEEARAAAEAAAEGEDDEEDEDEDDDEQEEEEQVIEIEPVKNNPAAIAVREPSSHIVKQAAFLARDQLGAVPEDDAQKDLFNRQVERAVALLQEEALLLRQLAILAARNIYAASKGFGTNENLMIGVLCHCSKQELGRVDAVYQVGRPSYQELLADLLCRVCMLQEGS
ncbi:hypothetical protein CYMTET_53169 [Cymbomonas tetramitiformis]|uniref:Uncharacterized protein n=1 Tax=Cymbomonas tetramitiformis TaxID=36881 RepID=A0AAE0EQV7_9CHLO|nr:hypothetical protein CYMTET_53169 [Cymbomonas tetramitiformis]